MGWIQGTSRPRLTEGSAWVEVAGDLVAVDASLRKVHVIGGGGARVMPLLDGAVSLAELAEDVAAVFGMPPDAALADLLVLSTHLAETGLLTLEPPRPVEPTPRDAEGTDRGRYLPRVDVACRDPWPEPAWVGSVAVQVGLLHVGITTDDPAVLARLRAVYSPHLVDDSRAPDDFGISTAPACSSGPRPLPFLTRGSRREVRSRNLDRLLRRLDVDLGALVREPPSGGWISLRDVAAVTRDDRAALVPTGVLRGSGGIERALRAAGLRLVEGSTLRVAPVAAKIESPTGLAGPEALDAWGDDIAAPAGTFELAAVVLPADQLPTRLGDGHALARMVRWVSDCGASTGAEVLTDLAGLLPRLRRPVLHRTPAAVVAALDELLGSHRARPPLPQRGPR